MLWWKVHEPDAPELSASESLQVVFARGHGVGELARDYVPGGVLIDDSRERLAERVRETAQALASGARVVYEAAFFEDGIFVAVDILERRRGGFVLTEVKSTLEVKDEHLADVAVQLHVVRRAGLSVLRTEVMHLNRECTYPDLSNLFVREDVTELVSSQLRTVPKQARALLTTLSGKLPDVDVGPHCAEPYECAFIERCRPPLPEHHVSTLYQLRRKRVDQLVAEGFATIHDIPEELVSGPARRQVRSVQTGKLVVEGGLHDALEALEPPIAFLDFETVNPAVPAWAGCHPYEQVPVQLSCHVATPRGLEHHEWLADRGGDPRERLAHALVKACAGAKTVLVYNASFERWCITSLIDAVPSLRGELDSISKRLRDLLPIVRNHVYHPEFGASFSLKSVVPAMVPVVRYEDLSIQNGEAASAALERLLLADEPILRAERKRIRANLLRYCQRDTLAMVHLYEVLCSLGGVA